MNKIKILSIFFLSLAFAFTSCEDSKDVLDVDYNTNTEGVITTLAGTSGKLLGNAINPSDLENSEVVLEDSNAELDIILSIQPGSFAKNVSKYEIVKMFNGANEVVIAETTSLPYTISYTTVAEFMNGFGLSDSTLRIGDQINFRIKVFTNSGEVYYQGLGSSKYDVTINCASDLAGAYRLVVQRDNGPDVIFENEINEIDKLDVEMSELLISKKAHLILPTHRLLDAASEKSKGKNKIGSTLKGIGPAYMDKTGRNGFRVGDLESENWKEKYSELKSKHKRLIDYYNVSLDYNFDDLEKEFFESIKNLKDLNFIDSEEYIQQEQNKGNSILAEGAQGSLLDIDFGTYPFVTSSNTTAAGACTGLGVSPNSIKEVFGIFKAYTTRVGSGPFPTELFDSNGERMGKVGNEFGATTGRSRRCGWLDLVALKYSCQINGVTKLMMMKSDVLSGFKSIKVSKGSMS